MCYRWGDILLGTPHQIIQAFLSLYRLLSNDPNSKIDEVRTLLSLGSGINGTRMCIMAASLLSY
jgi:hypothetical protein